MQFNLYLLIAGPITHRVNTSVLMHEMMLSAGIKRSPANLDCINSVRIKALNTQKRIFRSVFVMALAIFEMLRLIKQLRRKRCSAAEKGIRRE